MQVDVDGADRVQNGIILAKPKRAEPASGWEAVRLSRYDITRRPEDALARIRSIVGAGGGVAG